MPRPLGLRSTREPTQSPAVPPSSSLMRRMCTRPTATACCKQPRRTPYSPQSSTSVGRMRLTASFEMTPTPAGNQPVVPHAARVMVKVRSWQLVTARRSCATATRSRRAAPWERLTPWRSTRERPSVTSAARGRQRDHRGARSSSHVAPRRQETFPHTGARGVRFAGCVVRFASRPTPARTWTGAFSTTRSGDIPNTGPSECVCMHTSGDLVADLQYLQRPNPELHVCTSS